MRHENPAKRGRPSLPDTEKVSRRTANRRATNIIKLFDKATSKNKSIKRAAISKLCKTNFDVLSEFIKKRQENNDPLQEHEVVEIITNANLSENQFHTILADLKKKWPDINNKDLRRTSALRKKGLMKYFSYKKQNFDSKETKIDRYV